MAMLKLVILKSAILSVLDRKLGSLNRIVEDGLEREDLAACIKDSALGC
jgi:hypothetical protein